MQVNFEVRNKIYFFFEPQNHLNESLTQLQDLEFTDNVVIKFILVLIVLFISTILLL